MKAETIDVSKEGIRGYLEDAAETLKKPIESAQTMRLAVVRFILDSAHITDSELRKSVAHQFLSTPGWFGCNNSAGRQALGIKPALGAAIADLLGDAEV